jgi:hypothetical protein
MPSNVDQRHASSAAVTALTPPELIDLGSKQEREIVNLRRQVAWFQRQIFRQKSERRLPEPEGVQGSLGEYFAAIPEHTPSERKSRVAAHERAHKPKHPANDADESTLFFDDKKVPVEVIHVPNPEAEGLTTDDYEIIGEKVSHRPA